MVVRASLMRQVPSKMSCQANQFPVAMLRLLLRLRVQHLVLQQEPELRAHRRQRLWAAALPWLLVSLVSLL
jgi:hypothetical protein